MPKYDVFVREVQIVTVRVEADSEQEAINKVDTDGYDTEGGTEFSHTLDTEFWTAEKVEEKKNAREKKKKKR